MANTTPWRNIILLNMVSTLSQIGQYGIGFVVLPLWLVDRGFEPQNAGIFAGMQWTGMLIALFLAPVLVVKLGAKFTVSAGLILSVFAFFNLILFDIQLAFLSAILTGMGVGLRWIANETWLFRMIPSESGGRIVGVHEALIATAGVIAPAFPLWLGIAGHTVFFVGIVFTVLALLPLWFAKNDIHIQPLQAQRFIAPLKGIMLLGVVVSIAGGLVDGALYGLFPVFAESRGWSVHDTTVLLLIFGIGAIATQFPIGWLADIKGLKSTVFMSATVCFITSLLFLILPNIGWSVYMTAFVLGGMTAAFLTLGVYASSKNADYVARNVRLVSVAFTTSSILGPFMAGFVMHVIGNEALMWQIGVVCALLLTYIFISNNLYNMGD